MLSKTTTLVAAVVCPPNDYVVTVMSLAEVVDEEEAGDYGDGAGRRHRQRTRERRSRNDFMNYHDTSTSIPWHIIKR